LEIVEEASHIIFFFLLLSGRFFSSSLRKAASTVTAAGPGTTDKLNPPENSGRERERELTNTHLDSRTINNTLTHSPE